MLSALQFIVSFLEVSIIKQYFFYASGVLTCMWLFLLAFIYLLHAAVSLYIHSENKSAMLSMLCNFVIAIFPSEGFSGGSQSSVFEGEVNS